MPSLRIHMLMWLKKITKSECTLVHKRTHARTQRWFCLPFYFTWINVKFLTIFVAWVVFRGCQLLSFFWIHLLVLVNVNALHFVYLPLAHTKTNEHRTTYAWINKINAKKLRKHNAIFWNTKIPLIMAFCLPAHKHSAAQHTFMRRKA